MHACMHGKCMHAVTLRTAARHVTRSGLGTDVPHTSLRAFMQRYIASKHLIHLYIILKR